MIKPHLAKVPTNAAQRSLVSDCALELVSTNRALRPRNIMVMGHRTSVRLEPAMWDALRDIAAREKRTINEIVSAIALRRTENGTLSSAIRIYVMAYFRARSQAA